MKFEPALREGILIKRYKRFLADITASDGSRITLHCPNTGSMLNCCKPGWRIWFSTSDNPKRKYAHTLELVESADSDFIGINTNQANNLVDEALRTGIVDELKSYRRCQREVRFGDEKSRIDFLLSNSPERENENCHVEVKNVTLGLENGLGAFPDAVTARGQKHLRELIRVKSQGGRAVLLFCVQHSGITKVVPADHIDADYGRLLRSAAEAGVELLAYKADLSPYEIRLSHRIPIDLSQHEILTKYY